MSKKELKENNQTQESMEVEELDMDDLDQVSGGVGLRDAGKVKATEISKDPISKI